MNQMRKVIKILGSVLSAIVMAAIILPIILALALNIGVLQNFIVKKATAIISEKIGTEISIDHISLRGYSRLTAEGLYVEDYQGDTLLHVNRLSARLGLVSLLHNDIIISDATLDGAKIYLHQPEDGMLNISEVIANIPNKEKEKGKSVIVLSDFYMSGSSFRYRNERPSPKDKEKQEGGIDFSDMDFSGLSLGCRRLEIAGSDITMDMHGMAFTDKSGFRMELMEMAEFKIGDGALEMDDILIKMNGSELRFPIILLRGENGWPAFSDMYDKVRITVAMNDSELNLHSLAYFVPSLFSMQNITAHEITLDFDGTLNDFGGRISSFRNVNTGLTVDYHVTGLLREEGVDGAVFDIALNSLETDGNDAVRLLGLFAGQEEEEERRDSTLMTVLSNAGKISVTAEMKGRIDDFAADAGIVTDAGEILFAGTVAMPGNGKTAVDGNVTLNGIEAGLLTGNEMFGTVSLTAGATGTIDKENPDIRADIRVSELGLNGYTYRNISFNGTVKDKRVSGIAAADDPALKFELRGEGGFGGEVPSFNATLDILKADLAAMKLNERDSVSVVSGRVAVQGSGSSLDNMNGRIDVTGLAYYNGSDSLRVDTITLTGENDIHRKHLALESSYIEAEFNSGMSYKDIFDYLGHIIFDYVPSLQGVRTTRHEDLTPLAENARENSRLTVNVKETDAVIAIFIPGLSLAKGTSLELDFNPRSERFSLEAKSDFVEYGDYFVTGLNLTADNGNPADSLRVAFTTGEIFVPGLEVPTTEFRILARDDRADFEAAISNSLTNVNAHLSISSMFSRDEGNGLVIKAAFNPSSYMIAEGLVWDITSSEITYAADRIEVSEFRIHNDGQELFVDGIISKERSDTLNVRLNDLSLTVLTGLTQKSGYIPEGFLTGYADLSAVLDKPRIVADIRMRELGANGYIAAPLHFSSIWDFSNERARMTLTNESTGTEVLRGYYRPSNGNFLADLDIQNLPLALIEPVAAGAVAGTDGTVGIKAEVRITDGKPRINGDIDINGLATTVVFTRTAYTMPRTVINISDNIVTVPPTKLIDLNGAEGGLEATLDLTDLSAMSYDVRFTPDKLMVMNTTAHDSDSFYGKVFTSGNIRLHGDKMGINVTGAISTDSNTAVYVPVSGSSRVAAADFITYERKTVADPLDYLDAKKQSYRQARQQKAKQEKSDFKISASVNITPETMLQIVIDAARNDALVVRGNASLNANINLRTNDFSVSGTYEITDGHYLFSFQNIISNKLFTIRPGSTIQFSGDPMDAILNIEAVYSLRVSLAPLVREGGPLFGQTSYSKGRVPVDCIIRIGDRLSQPDITFDVQAQTNDSYLQSILNSMLASQEMMATQFVWLVAFSNFSTESFNTGPVSGTAIGVDFVTNQLNNLLANLDDDTTINIRYRPEDGINSDEIDFGFTKEFFDSRLILEYEGVYDTGYQTGTSAYNDNPLTNDLSVTALLNDAGNIRMKIFTRTIDRFDDLQRLQENGIGIYYREDFDKFSEIRGKIKKRRELSKARRAMKKAAGNGEPPVPEETDPVNGGENGAPYGTQDLSMLPGNDTAEILGSKQKTPLQLQGENK